MSATSTQGLETWMTVNPTTPTVEVPTAISAAKPAACTVVGSTAVPGDLVFVAGTDFPELDNKWFTVDAASTATSLILTGSDTTGSAATLGATPTLTVYAKSNMVKLCLATVDPAVNAAGVTSTATFCEPLDSVPALPQPGTLTMTGYVELGAAYDELNMAVADKVQRTIQIVLPQSLGDIIVNSILGSIGWQLPVDGAVGFTVTGAIKGDVAHRY